MGSAIGGFIFLIFVSSASKQELAQGGPPMNGWIHFHCVPDTMPVIFLHMAELI